jgi:nicotinate-nucleotide pyrophosphorylase (carboxylating)
MVQFAALDDLIDRALAEDLQGGDLTSRCCVEAAARAEADAIARVPVVACGGGLFRRVFERIDPTVEVALLVAEGERVSEGTVLWRAAGSARSLLAAERTALNFVQRLTGIATLARRFVDAVPTGTRARIVDTRKTTPGLRALERYAVRTGGAHNHRNDLGSAVLIKDNHIAAAGGVAAAVERARQLAPHTSRIEVEVTNLAELEQALAAGADIVMLDNMDTQGVERAVARVRGWVAGPKPLIEVSGGVSLARIPELARAGVDVISVGALTHSAPAADISLELRLADELRVADDRAR